jgi:hypothetical protein
MPRRKAAGGVMAVMTTAMLTLSLKEWSATIRPQDGSTVSGTATVVPRDGDSLLVTIRIQGAKAADSHPWHVHNGGCDSSGAVIGSSSRYAPMNVGANGGGEATARVKASLTIGVPYSVNVHRSPGDQGVIACGNLRPVAGRE